MRKDNEIQTDRRSEGNEVDFEQLLKEFELQRKERNRRSRNKSKKNRRREK